MIKAFNSLSGKKEVLPSKRPLRLFVCGPTVYDVAHLGHARTFIAFDIIANYLKSRKIPVFYLQNITDVDNKIITKAKEEKISPIALARKIEKDYHEDEKKLLIKSAKYARATDHIPEITKQIKTLIKKGNAYKIENDGYYFNISTFPEYGKLSKRTVNQAEDATSRIDEGVNKKNKGDFALWKFSKKRTDAELNSEARGKKFFIAEGEPVWRTPLGWGRPGWHIEDTAITEKYFGPQYEIHGGASELKFPHHEAEIAQQESASGKKPLVKIWMHTGILLINGEKMSKSLGNYVSIKDFLKKYDVNTIRYIFIGHHYRAPLNYTSQLAIEAQKNISDITEFILKLSLVKKPDGIKFEIKKYDNLFYSAMDDDFNSPKALAVIFSLINKINTKIKDLSKKQALLIKKWVKNKLAIFKISLKEPEIPLEIKALSKKRELLRNNKQFAKSDLLRKKIEALGYKVEDTLIGTLVLPNN